MEMDKLFVKASKRKKRRTRKSLDEIRKRTLKINDSNETISCNQGKPNVASYITSNRLTLVKKAIRSETVTRSLLSKLRKNNTNNMVILPTDESCANMLSNVSYIKEHIPFDVNTRQKSPLISCSDIEDHKTPDTIILFSSSDSDKVTNDKNELLSNSSNSSPLNLLMQNDRSLYDEFMSNLESYVHETTSNFLKTDTVCKYKEMFKDNFLENKLDRTNKQTVNPQSLSTYKNSDSDESVSQNANEFSLEQSRVPCPTFHRSPTVSESLPSSPLTCCGHDSPEYFYYPHRLNH